MAFNSGIKYFMDIYKERINKVLVGFDFLSGFQNNNIVYPEISTAFALTGHVNNTGNFYKYQGSGNFDGNTFINFNTPVNFEQNYTFLFSYERKQSKNEILISSLMGDSFETYSGFYIGVNDANKIYFKYWNPVEGAFTLTSKKIISDKNLMAINRSESTISIGQFNNNSKLFEFESFDIYQNTLYQSNQLYIGGSPITNELTIGSNNFSGLIDKFYLLKDFPLLYINTTVSGLYSSPISAEGYTDKNCYLTGYNFSSGYVTTGITGSISEKFVTGSYKITGSEQVQTGLCYYTLTGYKKEEVGRFINGCYQEQIIYRTIPLSGEKCDYWFLTRDLSGWVPSTGIRNINLTGFKTGFQNIWITGEQCDYFFIITGDILYDINTPYLESLGYPQISIFYKTDKSKDTIEVYHRPYSLDSLNYNTSLEFDNLNQNNFYIDADITSTNEISLFANGQALANNGYELIQNGYEVIKIPTADYFVTGNTIETDKFFGLKDDLFYDYFTGQSTFYPKINSISGEIIYTSPNSEINIFIFKNGKKFIEGIDYYIIRDNLGMSAYFLNDDLSDKSNYFLIKEYNYQYNYLSGNSGTLLLNTKFNNGCSQVYYNGIRQKINTNYIENAHFDKISGDYNFKENTNIIYNNTDDFFERG